MAGLPKHVIIVCSTGRTATTFFADMLSRVITGAYSTHEPDVWPGSAERLWSRIEMFGLYHMVVGRLIGRTGMRNLSQRYLAGRLPLNELAAAVMAQREGFYRSLPGDPVIEANNQWSGVLPALPHTGWRYRVVAIVRDPRTWVSSSLNHGYVFGRRDLVLRLRYRRLDPKMVGDAAFAEQWPQMTPFEKSCWTWLTINRALVRHIERDERARIFRYEDLFLGEDRVDHFQQMLQFAVAFEDKTFDFQLDPELLSTRVNAAARDQFPDWQDWAPQQAQRLNKICGPLMKRFGYGHEPCWQGLTANRVGPSIGIGDLSAVG